MTNVMLVSLCLLASTHALLVHTTTRPPTKTSSACTLAADVEPAIRPPHKSQPRWVSVLNGKLDMPLITKADDYHMHALAGSAWILLGYGLLFAAWSGEATASGFSSTLAATFGASAPLLATAGAGIAVGITGFPMRPKRRFRNYANQMRNSMTSTALLSLMSAAFALDASGSTLPAVLSHATHGAVAVGAAYMAYEAVAHRTPWDIAPVVDDLKLERPPDVALSAARTISIGWLAMAAAATSHALLAGGAGASPEASAFAAQMALSLAMAPSSEALVGTLCMKYRFTKAADAHVLVTHTPNGGLRPSHWLEAIELALNVPGPALLTVLVALHAGRADLVCDFFFFLQ